MAAATCLRTEHDVQRLITEIVEDAAGQGDRWIEPSMWPGLAADEVMLAVCPTSNALLSVVPSLAEHPLPGLLAAGVKCSVNADDPLLFGSDLVAEYEVCRQILGLDDAMLAELARTSFTSSAAPAAVVERGLADIDAWLKS